MASVDIPVVHDFESDLDVVDLIRVVDEEMGKEEYKRPQRDINEQPTTGDYAVIVVFLGKPSEKYLIGQIIEDSEFERNDNEGAVKFFKRVGGRKKHL